MAEPLTEFQPQDVLLLWFEEQQIRSGMASSSVNELHKRTLVRFGTSSLRLQSWPWAGSTPLDRLCHVFFAPF